MGPFFQAAKDNCTDFSLLSRQLLVVFPFSWDNISFSWQYMLYHDKFDQCINLHQYRDVTFITGDGTETRHEYTEFVCATSPALYQLSHYLFDEYDMNGDHHLRKEDYDNLHATMDTDSRALFYTDISRPIFFVLFTSFFARTTFKR